MSVPVQDHKPGFIGIIGSPIQGEICNNIQICVVFGYPYIAFPFDFPNRTGGIQITVSIINESVTIIGFILRTVYDDLFLQLEIQIILGNPDVMIFTYFRHISNDEQIVVLIHCEYITGILSIG